MALSAAFNVPLNLTVQGDRTVPIVVSVSIGEPIIVTHEPKPQFDPQIRNCAQCGRQYHEPLPVIYPQCGDCRRRQEIRQEEEWDRERASFLLRQEAMRQYRLEVEEEERAVIPSPPPRPSFNEINGVVNWKKEGF